MGLRAGCFLNPKPAMGFEQDASGRLIPVCPRESESTWLGFNVCGMIWGGGGGGGIPSRANAYVYMYMYIECVYIYIYIYLLLCFHLLIYLGLSRKTQTLHTYMYIYICMSVCTYMFMYVGFFGRTPTLHMCTWVGNHYGSGPTSAKTTPEYQPFFPSPVLLLHAKG